MIRNMTASEVSELVNWAASEGWNPGLHDAESFFQIDPEGFLAWESEGRLVGGGGIVKHNPNFGFMGLFIMQPDFRGQGLGTKLWYARRDRLLERLGPGATIGLDAVTEMIPFYARGGFETWTRHIRYEGKPIASAGNIDTDVIDLKEIPLAEIQSLDEQCFPGHREKYLTTWLNLKDSHALARVCNDRFRGYCVMRRCLAGWKIGPMFAEHADGARALLQRCFQLADSGPVYLDVPENNPPAIRLCELFQMHPVFECTRMYLGPKPKQADRKIFGITTLELG